MSANASEAVDGVSDADRDGQIEKHVCASSSVGYSASQPISEEVDHCVSDRLDCGRSDCGNNR